VNKSTSRLFRIEGSNLDPRYIDLRDSRCGPSVEFREKYDRMWQTFEPYADSNYPQQLSIQTVERLFEMYIACTFIDMGYKIQSDAMGPDFGFHHNGRCHWIEATCPGPGINNNPDRIARPIDRYPESSAGDTPVQKIMLRLTSALEAKSEMFSKYRRRDIVKDDDVCIIAISGEKMLGGLPGAGSIPYICNALFGVGPLQVTFDPSDLQNPRSNYLYQPEIRKANGTTVSTAAFHQTKYQHIGGVLFFEHPAFGFPREIGADMVTVHNPMATNPIDETAINRGIDYRLVNGELTSRSLVRPDFKN